MCSTLFRRPLLEKSLLCFSSRIEQHFSPKVLLFRKTDLVRVLHICSNIKLMQSDLLGPSKPNFGKVKGLCVPGGASPQCSTHLESSLLCSFWTTSTRVLCSCSNHIFSPAILSAGGRWRSWGSLQSSSGTHGGHRPIRPPTKIGRSSEHRPLLNC